MSESIATAGTPAPSTSSPPSQGAICPGQKSLMEKAPEMHGHRPFLRAVFTVYWDGACPSTEVFYLAGFPLRLHPKGITALEAEVLTTLQDWNDTTRALRAIFLTYIGVQMSDQDIEEAGWRMIGPPNGVPGDPVPAPPMAM